MHFYHYTSSRNVEKMLSGETYGQTGVLPLAQLMPLSLVEPCGLPPKATERVIFGLLDPFDPAWCRPVFGQDQPLLENVIRRIETSEDEICLLELTLAPGDEAYVVNYASRLQPYRPNDGHSFVEKINSIMHAYWQSRVPLADYVESNITHMVPEVICFDVIPLPQIRLVEVFEKDTLIDLIRSSGYFAAMPSRCQHEPEIPKVEPERPDLEKPRCGSHLRLV